MSDQSSAPPRPAPETSQFDFWLGEWDVTWDEKPGGVNRIERAFDGHVIMERFDGGPVAQLQGMSVSVYDIRIGHWRQTWVDNAGGYLDFVGDFADGKMILSRDAVIDGKPVKQRMVWFDIQPDALRWNWERSDDGGATWTVNWAIAYRRRK